MVVSYETMKESCKNKVWERFDRIVALGCEKFDNRIPVFTKELHRIGILPYVKWSIDYKNPFLDILNDVLPFRSYDNKRYFRCVYNHYVSVLSAYRDGCGSVLVLEDDVVFLKDVELLSRWILDLPSDYDLAMFDKNICPNSKNLYVGLKGWFPIEGRFNSAGCYALSRRGMERIIKSYEQGLHSGLMNFDVLFTEKSLGKDIRRYASFPNLAIQRNNSNSECPAMAEYLIKLRKSGVDMDAYNITITETAEKIFRNAHQGESINEVLDRLIKEETMLDNNSIQCHNNMSGDLSFTGSTLHRRRYIPVHRHSVSSQQTYIPRSSNW